MWQSLSICLFECKITKKSFEQFRSFLGLASYYRKYVPDFAIVAAPLTDATKKGQPNEIQ